MATKKTTTRKRTTSRASNDTVTIIGRVSTTLLNRGDKVTVTKTPTITDLINKGYVEIVK